MSRQAVTDLVEQLCTSVAVLDTNNAIATLPGLDLRWGNGRDEFLRSTIPSVRKCPELAVKAWFDDISAGYFCATAACGHILLALGLWRMVPHHATDHGCTCSGE